MPIFPMLSEQTIPVVCNYPEIFVNVYQTDVVVCYGGASRHRINGIKDTIYRIRIIPKARKNILDFAKTR